MDRQDQSVNKLFSEQIDHYTQDHHSAENSPLIPLLLSWIKREKIKRTIKICEFGGGDGLLLKKIGEAYPNARLTNVEIVASYKKHLKSKKIEFVTGSLLKSSFPDKSFDVLIIRDVIHHLVGKSYKETQNNQKYALSQLKRLIKPNGLILIEELTHSLKYSGKIIYFLSRLNSKIGVRLSSYQITPHAIVAFMTPYDLLKTCFTVFGKNAKINHKHIDLNADWKSRSVHLGGRVSKELLLIQL